MTASHKTADTPLGAVSYLEAGEGAPLVLLHGIGSGAASWTAQLDAFADRYRVIAWNAPGYGASDRIGPDVPAATDYAAHLSGLLDALDLPDCNLVGHSLGAIVACGFARAFPDRVKSLMIASPAAGYGSAGRQLQEKRRTGRMSLMNELGPEGLARERHGNLLSENAPQWARDRVREVMSQLRPDGYRQAVELLVNGDIKSDAAEIDLPATVVVGGADTVTPPEGCKAVADCFATSTFEILPGLGHACYVEGPDLFNAALDAHLEKNG
ncbi:MAG: alpha/beta fold hydrolase [Alphaproteobacteria bacterium]